MKLLLLSVMALLTSIPSALATSNPDCVKYVYADIRNKKDGMSNVFACRKIENQRATNCSQIGTLNVDKLDQKKKWAIRQMIAYGLGYSMGMACKLSVSFFQMPLKGAKPWVQQAIRGDKRRAESITARRAMKQVEENQREPGTMPGQGLVEFDHVTKGCRWLGKALTNRTKPHEIDEEMATFLGYDTVISMFHTNAALNAVWAGDYQAILRQYPDVKNQQHLEARREAVKKMQERIDRSIAEQAKILDTVVADAQKLYSWATDGPTTIFMGYSPDNVSNDLKCIAEHEQEIQQMLCKIATSEGKISNYYPGDAFSKVPKVTQRGLEGVDERAKALIQFNCKAPGALGPGIDKSPHDVEIPYP